MSGTEETVFIVLSVLVATAAVAMAVWIALVTRRFK